MTAVPALLAPIRERADKATDGPWTTTPYGPGDHSYDGLWVTSLDREVIADMTTDLGEDWEAETRANLAFIAAARTDVPRLLAALDAVLALHQEVLPVDEPLLSMAICDECERLYPCPTVAAVVAALQEGQ